MKPSVISSKYQNHRNRWVIVSPDPKTGVNVSLLYGNDKLAVEFYPVINNVMVWKACKEEDEGAIPNHHFFACAKSLGIGFNAAAVMNGLQPMWYGFEYNKIFNKLESWFYEVERDVNGR